jgi:hypothetical protein
MQQNNEDEDEGADLIPKDMLPKDPSELNKELPAPTADKPNEPEEDPEVVETPEVEDEPEIESPDNPEKEPAPVEGETAKEKALRITVNTLRNQLRETTVKKTFEESGANNLKSDAYEVLKGKYTPEVIADMEMAIETIAASKGFVKQDYGQTVQDVVDTFTDQHPEYKPSNDAGDVRWSKFNELLKDGTYNLSGKSPKQLAKIFDKVHEDVAKEFGETAKKTVLKPTERAAQIHKTQVVSHSGGNKGITTPKTKEFDYSQPIGGIRFKGFDDDE